MAVLSLTPYKFTWSLRWLLALWN